MYSFHCPAHGLSHGMLDLGEELFDWIEIGAVGRQEEQSGSGLADDASNVPAFVAAKIVEHDDVAGLECLDELGLDVGLEGLPVDRSVQHPWRIDAVIAERGDEGHCLPVGMGRMGDKPLVACAPASERSHVGLDPGLVEKDQTVRIDAALTLFPLLAPPCQLRPVLLDGK